MIAVTGAGGFVASHLMQLLLKDAAPRQLRGIVRDPATDLPPGVEARTADVTRADTLRGAFDGCEAVVHTVAVPTERRQRFSDVNARGVANVAAEAHRAGARLVHMSVLGADPASRYPYLRSRGEGELAITLSGIAHTIVRSSLLFGRGDDFFPRLRFSLRFPVVPIPGDGRALFQPLHVDDLAQVLAAALRGEARGAFEVGGPERVSYEDLVRETMRALGLRRRLAHVPVALLKPGAVALGVLLRDPPVTPGQLDLLGRDDLPAGRDIEQVFGVSPRPFHGGLGYLRMA